MERAQRQDESRQANQFRCRLAQPLGEQPVGMAPGTAEQTGHVRTPRAARDRYAAVSFRIRSAGAMSPDLLRRASNSRSIQRARVLKSGAARSRSSLRPRSCTTRSPSTAPSPHLGAGEPEEGPDRHGMQTNTEDMKVVEGQVERTRVEAGEEAELTDRQGCATAAHRTTAAPRCLRPARAGREIRRSRIAWRVWKATA